MTRGINIKVPNTCARLIGETAPEFVREATRDKCAEVEKPHGQRERAAKAAAREAGHGRAQ